MCVSLAIVGAVLVCAGTPSLVDSPIVLTQVPISGMPQAAPLSQGFLRYENARIVILNPDHSLRVLTAGFYGACDPEVSFDGKRILFSGKRASRESWNIFEVGADGQELRQITRGTANCRYPVYLSTLYTLVSDKPWHQVAYLSDLGGALNEDGTGPAANLYSCRLDGAARLRLTFSPSGVCDPFLMADGRLLFSSARRRYSDQPVSSALFGVNIDGTDFALFAGDEGRRLKRMPSVTSDGLAVFVETDRAVPDGAGMLSCVNLRRNHHSYRQITKAGEGYFLYPSPLPDGNVLVSRRSEAVGASHGVYEVDPISGKAVPVFDDPAYDDIQAKIVAPRAEPDGRSTSVLRRTGEIEDPSALESKGEPRKPAEMTVGKLYALNVRISNLIKAEWMPPGTVRRVRFLEGVPQQLKDLDNLHGSGAQRANVLTPAERASLSLQCRILGESPVEDDGSFNVQVPADIPIEVQLLDADGIALKSSGWIWVKNNEPRGCIGCHEDPELVPQNRLMKAITKPSVLLTLPPERRRTVDFVNDILPVVRAKCASCHKTGGPRPKLDELPSTGGLLQETASDRLYNALVAQPESGKKPGAHGNRYVIPGQARTSPLIWHIFGRNTSRPWDRAVPGAKVKIMPLSGASLLSGEEKRTFVEWIDLGALRNSRVSGTELQPGK